MNPTFFFILFNLLAAKKRAIFAQKYFALSNNDTGDNRVAYLKVADGGLLPLH